MIKCYLFKPSSIWNFHNKKNYLIFSRIAKQDCVIKTTEIFNSFPLINNSVSIAKSSFMASKPNSSLIIPITFFVFFFRQWFVKFSF